MTSEYVDLCDRDEFAITNALGIINHYLMHCGTMFFVGTHDDDDVEVRHGITYLGSTLVGVFNITQLLIKVRTCRSATDVGLALSTGRINGKRF